MSRVRLAISLAFSILLLIISVALCAGGAYAWFSASDALRDNVIQTAERFPNDAGSSGGAAANPAPAGGASAEGIAAPAASSPSGDAAPADGSVPVADSDAPADPSPSAAPDAASTDAPGEPAASDGVPAKTSSSAPSGGSDAASAADISHVQDDASGVARQAGKGAVGASSS